MNVIVMNMTSKETIQTELILTPREKALILEGGLLNSIKNKGGNL